MVKLTSLQESYSELESSLENLTSAKFTEKLQLKKAEIMDALPNFMTKIEFENIKETLNEKFGSLRPVFEKKDSMNYIFYI